MKWELHARKRRNLNMYESQCIRGNNGNIIENLKLWGPGLVQCPSFSDHTLRCRLGLSAQKVPELGGRSLPLLPILNQQTANCKRCSNLAWQKHFPGGLREVRCGMALDALVDGNKRQKNPVCSWTGNITVMLDLKNAGKSKCHGKVRVEGGGACSSTYGIIFGSADTNGEHFLYIKIYLFKKLTVSSTGRSTVVRRAVWPFTTSSKGVSCDCSSWISTLLSSSNKGATQSKHRTSPP